MFGGASSHLNCSAKLGLWFEAQGWTEPPICVWWCPCVPGMWHRPTRPGGLQWWKVSVKVPNEVCDYGSIRHRGFPSSLSCCGGHLIFNNEEVTRGREVLLGLARQHLSKLKPKNCSYFVRVLVISHVSAIHLWGGFFPNHVF